MTSLITRALRHLLPGVDAGGCTVYSVCSRNICPSTVPGKFQIYVCQRCVGGDSSCEVSDTGCCSNPQ